jgi:hypothetical protein
MASPVGQPLIVKIPVNNDMVQRAFSMLRNRLVHRNEDLFQISTNTINHSDIDGQIRLLLEEYEDADEEVKAYIKRLKLNHEGQQFAKAIVVGTKSRLSVSVIATRRTKIGAIDQHKILIATMTKIVEMSSSSSVFPNLFSSLFPLNLIIGLIFPWALFPSLLGIAMDDQLKDILRQLNEEENKKCLEAMAFYLLGDKIQASLGDRVEVQFIQQ